MKGLEKLREITIRTQHSNVMRNNTVTFSSFALKLYVSNGQQILKSSSMISLQDMIIRGGENIYPTEIEQFLYKHPKVEDVQVQNGRLMKHTWRQGVNLCP